MTERIQTTYKQLSRVAVELSTVSDELSKPIKAWDTALQKLNLGIPAWAVLSKGGDCDYWWNRSVGYTKLKDRWGIALRTREGWEGDSESDKEEVWAFNDAPRWMRIESINKLPDVLEALLKQAQETIKTIRTKIEQGNALAEAITTVADGLAVAEQEKK